MTPFVKIRFSCNMLVLLYREIHRFYLSILGCLYIYLFCFVETLRANVVQIDEKNFRKVLASEIVFLNFYADWCHYSRQLEPIFLQASENFPPPPNFDTTSNQQQKTKVVFGKVDCVKEENICSRNRISKYPTVKLFRGSVPRKEYRSTRSVEAITNFINEQLKTPFKEYSSNQELNSGLNKEVANVIGYFVEKTGTEWNIFESIAFWMRDHCEFSVALGPTFASSGIKSPAITFLDPAAKKRDIFNGDLTNEQYVRNWIKDKCIPLIMELTFENAEGLTEAGLPFLVLFKRKDDVAALETFSQAVERELTDQRGTSELRCPFTIERLRSIVILHADGEKFSHPLYHLGKTVKDLPVIAIDSFQHMYLFPKFDDLRVNGKLLKFVKDLHSERLHKRFHNQPVDDDEEQEKEEAGETVTKTAAGPKETTTKTKSIFKNLKPSPYRYTLLANKDEL